MKKEDAPYKYSLTKEEYDKAVEEFKAIDLDNNGYIDANELAQVLISILFTISGAKPHPRRCFQNDIRS